MAHKSNIKSPPLMREGLSYKEWKEDVYIWSDVTDLPPKKQAGAVFLSLTGKAQTSVRASVSREEMSSELGLKTVLGCLDKLYEKDAAHSGYTAYENFTEFRRPANMSTEDYLIEFNIRYSKIKSLEMTLPDGVLAYYVLKCANLSEEQINICKATCDTLTYELMRKQIERVTSSAAKNKNNDNELPVQFYTEFEEHPEESHFDADGSQYYDEFELDQPTESTFYTHPSSRGGRPFRHQNNSRINAPDQYGNPSKCSFCHSIYHYRGACPDANQASNQNFRSGRLQQRGGFRGRFQRGGLNSRFQHRGDRGFSNYI